SSLRSKATAWKSPSKCLCALRSRKLPTSRSNHNGKFGCDSEDGAKDRRFAAQIRLPCSEHCLAFRVSGFAFRFSSFAFRFSMLRIFRGFGGADRHVRRQFLESLLRNPRHGQQILGALERSALRAKIDDRLRRHWPDPRQLLELLQRRRIQIN